MSRTTLDIDEPILSELRELAEQEGKSMGKLASELLARALAERASRPRGVPRLVWNTTPGAPAVDLRDKDALWRILDDEDPARRR